MHFQVINALCVSMPVALKYSSCWPNTHILIAVPVMVALGDWLVWGADPPVVH